MRTRLHASAVAAQGRAVLIQGASGSGKSTLALQLLAFGARLISDDQTQIERQGGVILASHAPNIAGLVEARGVGILNAPRAEACPLYAVVDLDSHETERLPQRSTQLLGVDLPLFHKCENPAWPAAIWLYLCHGMADR